MRNFNIYEVNIKNLRCNISLIKRVLKENVKLCAVVKANAYGVGYENVCNNIDDLVDYFAVSNVFEAKQIRSLGIETKILVLGVVAIDDIDYCIKNNISITISNLEYIKAICEDLHSSLNVHIKINTGLNRYGVKNIREYKKIINYIHKKRNIVLEGVYTHFATKSNDLEFISIQKNIFDEFCDGLDKKVIKHCANSFATVLSRIMHCDMVRIGANMYGDIRGEKLPLKNVVNIYSEVVAINIVQKSQSVGYDKMFTATKCSKIAVVPLGYADGINRQAGNRFYVLVNGKKANIVGNVCMDCFMIDITNIKDVYIGSKVVIIGESGEEKLMFYDWAKALKTSPYNILLGFRYNRMEYKIIDKNENL